MSPAGRRLVSPAYQPAVYGLSVHVISVSAHTQSSKSPSIVSFNLRLCVLPSHNQLVSEHLYALFMCRAIIFAFQSILDILNKYIHLPRPIPPTARS